MKRLVILCTCILMICSLFAVGEVDPSAIHKIVLAEFAAMRLPTRSPICLAILPARNTSETGADPSPQLLAFLAQKGMRPRRVSTCYKPLPKGNVIIIEPISESANRLSVKVTFGDTTITPDRGLGILHRRGVYELIKGEMGEWAIQSYAGESFGAPGMTVNLCHNATISDCECLGCVAQ